MCLSRPVLSPWQTCVSSSAKRNLITIVCCRPWLDRALGVAILKDLFPLACFAVRSICFTWLTLLFIGGVTVYLSVAFVHTNVCHCGVGLRSKILPFPLRLALVIMSWHLLGSSMLKVIVCCSFSFLLSFRTILITSSTITQGRSCLAHRNVGVPSLYFHGFLGLACDGLGSAEGGSNYPRIWDYYMLVSLLSAVCETLEKIGVMMVLRDTWSDGALGYMAYCRIRDVNCPQYSSSWLEYHFSMGEVSDVPYCSVSSTCRPNADGETISDSVLPSGPVLLVPWTSLHHQLPIHVCIGGCLSIIRLTIPALGCVGDAWGGCFSYSCDWHWRWGRLGSLVLDWSSELGLSCLHTCWIW